jgi:CRISPR system Cascade subunit CasB
MINELPDFTVLRRQYEALPRGARADLRRVSEPGDLSYAPAFYRLFPGTRPDDRYRRLAYLVPWCRHAAGAKALGAQLAESNVSEQRVLQTARSHAPGDLVQLRRLVMHIDAALDWSNFGRALWYWGDRAKRELVEDFYIAQFDTAKGGK